MNPLIQPSGEHVSDSPFRGQGGVGAAPGLLVVLGAGESGVGAALLGKQQGWEVFVSDGSTLQDGYKAELRAAGIEFEEGGHTESRVLAAQYIVKSPGIPEKAAIMKAVRAAGIEVGSEIEFGFRYKGTGRIIAITGSNGKSTTTKLTYHLLKNAGLSVSMVGNIGYSFARQLYEQPTVGSSRVDLQACKLEYSIVSPK